MNHKHDRFLNIAVEEANSSSQYMKHGCVAVMNGKIIGRGHNYSRINSSDGFLRCNCSLHAEINAIRNVYHTMGFQGDYSYHIKGEKG